MKCTQVPCCGANSEKCCTPEIVDDGKKRLPIINEKSFWKAAKKAQKLVASWPEWKRNAMKHG